jgi:diguanylate cyclase (GGDEF)-like protein
MTDRWDLPAELMRSGLQRLRSGAPFPELAMSILELVVESCGADGGRVEIRAFGEITTGTLPPAVPADGRRVVSREVSEGSGPLGSLTVKLASTSSGVDHWVEAVLEFGADLVATAWSHCQSLERERQGRQEEQGLVRASQALARTIRLADVLPVILEELRAVVPYDTASVQELQGDRVVIIGGAGLDLATFYGVGFDVEREGAPNADVVRRREPVIVADILGDHLYWNFPDPDHQILGVRCWMGVPLVFGEECVGMLTLDKYEPDFYTQRHARLAQSFAAQAAIALENARAFERAQSEVEVRREAEDRLREANEALHSRMAEIEALQEHLREQSVRDPLTGVFNRRYLMESLDRELPRARRTGSPLVVAVLDVDHFKPVNDALGHEAGDQVLAQVAGVLVGNVRDEDVVCRYGGEEFVVVLPGTTVEVATQRARRWQDELRSLVLPEDLSDRVITVSVGLASAPDHGSTGEALVRAADEAMYEAKRRGRDRIEIAGVA